MPTGKLCSIDGCGKPHYCLEWCNSHYRKWRRHGKPIWQRPSPFRDFVEMAKKYDGDDCLFCTFARNEKWRSQIRVDGKLTMVARIICESYRGPPPAPQHQAAHSCGNGHLACSTRKHLRWATQEENIADRLIHDTYGIKLINNDVKTIRSLYGKLSEDDIASMFDVSPKHVAAIAKRRHWKGLP